MDSDDTPGSPRKKLKSDHPSSIPTAQDDTIEFIPHKMDTAAAPDQEHSSTIHVTLGDSIESTAQDVASAPPKKRQTWTNSSLDNPTATVTPAMTARVPNPEQASIDQFDKEIDCGITELVSSDLRGFSGVLKQRYTDFLVNEILPSGQVVHLTNLRAPKREQHKEEGSKDSGSVLNGGEKAVKDTKLPDESSEPAEQDSDPFNGKKAKREEPKQQDFEQEELQHDETKKVENVFPARGNLDPLAHHFEEPQPHQRAHMPHLAAQLYPNSAPKPSPTKEVTRTRQKFHIRHTDQGWKEFGKDEAEAESTGSVAAKETTVRDAARDVPKKEAEDPPGIVQSTTSFVPKASSQAQWQDYADTKGELSAANPITDYDKDVLLSYFTEQVVDAICSLYNRILHSPHRATREYGTVKSAVIDRQLRTKIHQDVRRIFKSQLETMTDNDGAMIISAMPPVSSYNTKVPAGQNDRRSGQASRRGNHQGPKGKGGGWSKPNWQELGGEYLHFTLYKENKDTMEAISWLAKTLKLGPRAFEFAGTKDRRAVSAQRVSVYRIYINRLIEAGRTLKNAKIGDYAYRPHALQLGELTGNEFTITLRDCFFDNSTPAGTGTNVDKAHSIVSEAIKNLSERGFINYYGLQRFGTFSTGTHDIGVKILQGDFAGAVDAILHYTPESLAASQDSMSKGDKMSMDNKARSHAIHVFRTLGKTQRALADLPRKFSAESAIIRHLGGRAGQENDHLGALQGIPRNLRLMYVHAYQSLVWNVAVSERWSKFGSSVIEGDLVLVNEHTDKVDAPVKAEEVDEDGEPIIQPAAEDRATNIEDTFTRARALSKEEAKSGKYTIFDIVLPTPGYDILYPANEMTKFYEMFMASPRGGGLDPHDMRRQWKDASLSGSYRKLLAKPGKEISFEIKTYEKDDAQFVQTDIDCLNKARNGPKDRQQHHAKHDGAAAATEANGKGADEHEQDAPAGHDIKDDTNSDSEDDTEPTGGVRLDSKPDGKRIAVVLKLQLGSSQYATMALRELMKGGVKTYKPDFSGGR